MNPEGSEPKEKKRKNTDKRPKFAPGDIIIEMVHAKEMTDDFWKKFLDTNPNYNDLCIAICRATIARDKAWEELLRRGPDKEDLLYLFEHLRNERFLSYYVWEVLNRRQDLTRGDLEKVLDSPKIDSVVVKEAKRMMLRFPGGKILSQEEPDRGPIPEKIVLAQAKNDFIINKKKRQNPPWERDYRDPMCG